MQLLKYVVLHVMSDVTLIPKYCSPAHVMPLLEIVRTKKTSPQVIVDLLDVGKKIRKTPVVVGNCTGFAVNRMFFPYTQAALLLVDRGTDLYKIDKAITKFGMPMGPFRYFVACYFLCRTQHLFLLLKVQIFEMLAS